MTPAFGITYRATGQWLHIRRFDGEGKVLLTDNPLQAWVSFREQTTDSAQSVAAAQEFDRVIDIPGSDVRAGFVFGNPFSERPTEVWLLVDRLDPKAIADLLKPDPTSHDEFRGYISTNANIYVVVGTQVYEIERRGESGFALIPLEDQ